ncbi:MAG: methyl-accepting chemotaxis protein [Aestuariibacter sp.]
MDIQIVVEGGMVFLEGWLQHVKIRNKLIIGFGALLSLLLGIAVINYTSIVSLLGRFTVLNQVSTVNEHISTARYNEKKYLLRSQPEFIDAAQQQVDSALQLSNSITGNMDNRQSIAKMKQLETNANQYLQELGEFVAINEQSEQAQREMEVAAQEAVRNLKNLSAELEQQAVARIDATGDQQSISALATVRLINESVEYILQARKAERDYVYRGSDVALNTMKSSLEQAKTDIAKLEGSLQQTGYLQMIAVAQQEMSQYEQQFNEYRSLNAASENTQLSMTKEAREAVDNANNSVALQLQQLRSEASELKTIIVSAVIGAVLLAIMVIVVIARQIINPVNEVLVATTRLADGDLTQNLHSERRDEMGDLIRASQDMNNRLKDLIWNMISGVTQLASSSEQLAAVTEQNKAGVESQREDTEQVATAIEEMTSTAQEIARSAEDTSAATSESSAQAKQSDLVVEKTVTQINQLTDEIGNSSQVITELKAESKNVDNILDVIRDIAERTNLLALNAAIEAARAGEAGRGFAVVAQEVRDLAQRTQDSTNQIEGIIDSLQDKAEKAVQGMDQSQTMADKTIEMANDAKEAIANITKAIDDIQDRNYQVATAASQQSTVASDINEKVVSIRDVADETATATNQTAASSYDLSRLSAELQAQTKQFKMKQKDIKEAQQEGIEAIDAANLDLTQSRHRNANEAVMVGGNPILA